MIEIIEDYDKCSVVQNDDSSLPICFMKKRHTKHIHGINCITQSWRMKERMKTVSVALVLCLNVGVDPPDIVKIQPCARIECWIDPSSVSPQKALELIGSNLQKQYERWQPRARYKQSLDPTVDDVKKLCTSLRRNAKEERVLFHYNGHGVPRPTINGEIWVFNRTYTQYIPLSIYDLQSWMGAPSIYVYDCSNAGIIVNSFNTFAEQHERELEQIQGSNGSLNSPTTQQNQPSTTPPQGASTGGLSSIPIGTGGMTTFKNCIQLAACSSNQILPMNPHLPADLFTACLTTPIKIALKWFTLQQSAELVPHVTYELIEKLPGQINDRRTMLGELNWIFTAITDTIAWNTLSRDLFQKLFRQDLLVASLFRNFLLAERILRSYDCTPMSSPALPQGFRHPMWAAWDLALDLALTQLPDILEHGKTYQQSPFFEEQLTAFQVWLNSGSENRVPPEQLPIVLQVLLSQVHRLRALELLGRFLDLGPWAVNLALSVGIFPYVLKLLQSSAKELRPLLVFIWAKILAVDSTCQVDLVRDQGHKYFLAVLQDSTIAADIRTLSAFVLACIVQNFPVGQANALQGSLVSMCLVQINETSPLLRQWLAICLGNLWQNYDKARWSGGRDLAHEKLYPLLQDPIPEVRAAAVYALGTFISSVTQRSEHANNIDKSIAMTLLNTVGSDMSPLVRIQLIIALQWMVILFENQFVSVFWQEPNQESMMITSASTASTIMAAAETANLAASSGNLSVALTVHGHSTHSLERNINMKRVFSSNSIATMGSGGVRSNTIACTSVVLNNFSTTPIGFGSIYMKLWRGLMNLTRDPHPEVAQIAGKVIEYVRNKAVELISAKEATTEKYCSSLSLPPSPNTRTVYLGDSPPSHLHQHHPQNAHTAVKFGNNMTSTPIGLLPVHRNSLGTPGTTANLTNINFMKISKLATGNDDSTSSLIDDRIGNNVSTGDDTQKPIITSSFIPWTISFFACPSKQNDESRIDLNSIEFIDRKCRFKRNEQLRHEAKEQHRRVIFNRLETQHFLRPQQTPSIIKMHPYDPQIAFACKEMVVYSHLVNNIGYSLNPYIPISCVSKTSTASNSYMVGGSSITVKRVNKNQNSVANNMGMPPPPPSPPNLIGYPQIARVSSLEYINPHDNCLILAGHDDGCVRIWRPPTQPEDDLQLVSAWQALVDFSLTDITSVGLVTSWQQKSQTLVIGGEAKFLRLWDIEKEMKIVDYPTGADVPVRCLSSSPNCLVAAGCSDGSVRIFDKRCSPVDARIMTYREHSAPIVTACLRDDCESLVSGCTRGSVRLFDVRKTDSVLNWEAGADITAMAVHPMADIMVCGSLSMGLSIFGLDGYSLSSIKTHEGFMGPRIGQTTCLAFHPHKVSLSAGFADNTVAVYVMDFRKWREW